MENRIDPTEAEALRELKALDDSSKTITIDLNLEIEFKSIDEKLGLTVNHKTIEKLIKSINEKIDDLLRHDGAM